MQFHLELEIGRVESGRVRFSGPGRDREAGPGAAILIPPGIPHRVCVLAGPCDFSVVYVDWAQAQQLFPSLALPPRVEVIAAPPLPLAAASLGLEQLSAPGVRLRLRRALATVGDLELDCRPPISAGLEEAREFLARRLDRTPSLPEAAAAAGLSRAHFARSFKQAFGLSPISYHRQLRLLDAQRRLESGEQAQEVADALGFSDPAHLSRAFRRAFKVPPGQYRGFLADRPRED